MREKERPEKPASAERSLSSAVLWVQGGLEGGAEVGPWGGPGRERCWFGDCLCFLLPESILTGSK